MSITKEEMKLDKIKKAYEREARLLEELCNCLAQERQCLIEGRIGQLWSLREKKSRICEEAAKEERAIKEGLKDILANKRKDRPQLLIPWRKRINTLKLQISTRNAENMRIIQDTLEFLDGLIGAITMDEAQPSGYGRTKALSSSPKILLREA